MRDTRTRDRASWRRTAGSLAVVLLVGLPATAGAASGQSDRLSTLAERAPGRTIEAIVGLRPSTSASEARRLVRRHGGRVTGQLRLIRALTIRIGAGQAERLRGRAGIASVTRNAAVRPKVVNVKKLASSFPKSVEAPTTWKDYGVTGRGIGVAVIDTGIAGHLPDFRVSQKDTASRVVASAVVHPGASTAGDAFGHGTHVAGIIAGNGTARASDDPLFGKRIGIAPEAHLVSVKVSDDEGNATVLDVIRGLQFVVDHAPALGVRAVHLSLESMEPESYKTDALAAAVEAAWFRGLVVVAAAGNRGASAEAVKTAPGNDPFVISVGAFDDKSTQTASDDTIAEWSSRGTTQDNFAKPELHAPGSGIVSTLAKGSKFGSMCPSCIIDGDYIKAGGTSMSAPMVTGIVALMLEKNPKLTPDQVKGILQATVRTLHGGVPAVRATAAVDMANDSRLPTANVGLVPSELIDPQTRDIDYTRSSWSRSSWSSASDQLTASWARSSWSCSCLSGDEDVKTSRSSWSRSSWSTAWGL